MFCSKCGKEIDDSAVVCIGCGCPTAKYNSNQAHQNTQSPTPSVMRTTYGNVSTPQAPSYTSAYSEDDKIIIPKIRQYISEVNTIFILSIISIFLSMGIGFIFAIIGFVKIKNLPAIDKSIEDPNLIADFQKAQKKLGTATILMMLTFLVFVIAIFVGFIAGISA